jgi:hypothetical protein
VGAGSNLAALGLLFSGLAGQIVLLNNVANYTVSHSVFSLREKFVNRASLLSMQLNIL